MAEFEVYVTRRIPEAGLEVLRKELGGYSINTKDRVLSRLELIEACREKDGILCLLTDRFDAETIGKLARCKVLANCAVGYDNIDVPAAAAKGIVVTNTPGVLTETTADLAWALLMAAARRLNEAERFLRDGRFRGWGPMLFLGSDVHGKTLGLVGGGRIGAAMARRARGFGMEVLYADVQASPEIESLGAKRVELDGLLARSDFVSLHVPLTPETRHLMDAARLATMKRGAYLINTSRGPVVDEGALADALKSGQLSGAGLDVYEDEPRVHPALQAIENVVLVPHIGSASRETRDLMARMAAENLVCVLKGRPVPNPVSVPPAG